MTMPDQQLRYWLALARLPVSSTQIFRWLESVDDLSLLFSVPASQLKHIGIPEEAANYLSDPSWVKITEDLFWCDQDKQHHIITFEDEFYPKLLKEISNPPLVLYVKGDPKLLDSLQLAMVGSRNPTPTGKDTARLFAKHLAQRNITITSGLADGIDAASHEGALMASSGKTIAVLGTGLKIVYPAKHQGLASEIVANGGTLVSEFTPNTPPRPQNFPRRNRIISGLSLGTLVVEAALRSGSLITARFAAEQGREVFAVPGSIHNPLTKGCHKLIKDGAKLVETAQDILEELGPLADMGEQIFDAQQHDESVDRIIAGDALYQKLLKNLDVTATPVDILSQRTNLTIAEISSMLLVLELKGYVESAPSGYIKKRALV